MTEEKKPLPPRNITVRIATEGWTTSTPGLVITAYHSHRDDLFTITHEPTGYSIIATPYEDFKQIQDVATALGEVADWWVVTLESSSELAERVKAVLNANPSTVIRQGELLIPSGRAWLQL